MAKVTSTSKGVDKFMPVRGDTANATDGKVTGRASGSVASSGGTRSLGGQFTPSGVVNATQGKLTGHGSKDRYPK